MKKSTVKGNIYLLLTALIWGSAFVAQRVGMDFIGPFAFNAARSFLGSVALLPLILFRKYRGGARAVAASGVRAERKTTIVGGLIFGVVLFFASITQQIGMQYADAGKAGFVTALYIVIVPVMGGIFLKRKLRFNAWFGVALGIVGLYLLTVTDSLTLGKGDLWLIACAFFFSIHILVIDYYSPRADGVIMSAIQFAVSGALSLIFVPILESGTTWQQLFDAAIPILYTGVLSSGVAYTLQIIGQKYTPPTAASLLLSLESTFSALTGWALLGETLSLRELIGCGVMLTAIIIVQIPVRKRAKSLT